MARSRPYEHRFESVKDAAEYLKAAQVDSEEAFLLAVRHVMQHGLPVKEWPEWMKSRDPQGKPILEGW